MLLPSEIQYWLIPRDDNDGNICILCLSDRHIQTHTSVSASSSLRPFNRQITLMSLDTGEDLDSLCRCIILLCVRISIIIIAFHPQTCADDPRDVMEILALGTVPKLMRDRAG